MELHGDFDIPTFQLALNAIIRRHEVLRSGFRRDEDRIVVFVGSADVVPIILLKVRQIEPRFHHG